MDPQVLAEVRRLTAPEGAQIEAARHRAASLTPPPPEVCALLRLAVVASGARTAVEVGSAGGVSGLWLLGALPERGVLTSIEPDPHAHGLAVEAFEQTVADARVRTILGDPATVLPRLSDAGYDLMVLQTGPPTYLTVLEHARRLLRPGGWLVVRGALRPGEHADVLAGFVQALADDETFTAAVLPIEDGLAVAVRRAAGPGGTD